MKIMLLSFVTAVAFAVLANYTLGHMGFSTRDVASGPAVRLGGK